MVLNSFNYDVPARSLVSVMTAELESSTSYAGSEARAPSHQEARGSRNCLEIKDI